SIAEGWSLNIATTVNTLLDLAASYLDPPDSVPVGTNLTYTLSLTNRGPAYATQVVVTDPLPAGALFISASASQGSCAYDGTTVRCDLGNIAPGAQAVVTVTVTPSSAGLMTNVVTLASQEPDLNAANNSAAVVTRVTLPIDLAVSGADTSGWATLGDPF